MPKAAENQVVHESEAQRQFVRLRPPAQVEINEETYKTRDLSTAGVGLEDVTKVYKAGEIIDVVLELPFDSFSIDVEVSAQVRFYDKESKTMGCQFVNLTPRQISILNHVLKSFIAGDVVTSGDLMNVVSRENFVKVRGKQGPAAQERTAREKLQIILSYASVFLLGFFVLLFVLGNLFEHAFILKSSNAVVQADVVEMSVPINGVYASLVQENVETLTKGQPVAVIKSYNAPVSVLPSETPYETSRSITIDSPCDCFIAKSYLSEGEYGIEGSSLLSLIPVDAQPWISVLVAAEDVHNLEIGGKAVVKIQGHSDELSGEIVNVESSMSPNRSAGDERVQLSGIVTIKTEGRLSHDLIGRPAFVEFLLY